MHDSGTPAWRAAVDRTLAEYRSRTRAIAARLSAPEAARPPCHEPEDGHHGGDDGRRRPADIAVERIERGELSWADVLSGRATDPGSVALRTFLTARRTEIRARRRGHP